MNHNFYESVSLHSLAGTVFVACKADVIFCVKRSLLQFGQPLSGGATPMFARPNWPLYLFYFGGETALAACVLRATT